MAKKKSKTKEKDIALEKTKPIVRSKSTTPRLRKKLKDAQETQRFFLVLAIATLVLLFFLFLIFSKK